MTKNSNNAFHLCCLEGYTEIITYLIDKGININAINKDGFVGNHLANKCGYIDLYKYLNALNKKICYVCNKKSKSQCPNCDTKYCSRECQNIDWKQHKKICVGNK